MKLQNFFRTQVMVIGFGTVLLMANAAHAQEIDNTVWDDNTTVATPAQPAPAQTANDLNTVTTDSGALNLAAMSTTSIAARESSVPQWEPAKDWMLVSLVITIALVGVYSFAIAKRANQNLNARSGQGNRRAAVS